jgi:hypothetical protein
VPPPPSRPPAGSAFLPSTVPSLPPRPPATGPGARVCGCGCSRCAWWCLVLICGGIPSYEQRPRGSCLCHWGGRHLCSARAGVRWAKLAWRFGSPGCVGAVRRKRPDLLHCWRRRGGGWALGGG